MGLSSHLELCSCTVFATWFAPINAKICLNCVNLLKLLLLSRLATYLPIFKHKRAVVFPSLKRQGLDPSSPSNYRPISNLSFVSKFLERSILSQLSAYLDSNSLMPPLQSGFRKFHSTESLMTRLFADIFGAMDSRQVTLLALYDVSAAFDTVDHSILLERLERSFGVTGPALAWLQSFLSDRLQLVVFGSSRSSWFSVRYGLPVEFALRGALQVEAYNYNYNYNSTGM